MSGLKKISTGREVRAKELATGTVRVNRAKLVFVGAGGGSLPLLQKSGIPEAKGLGGFIADRLHACFSEAGVHQPICILLSAHPSNSLPMTPAPPTTSKRKTTDSVIAEVRRTKVKLLERFNYDLEAMARDVRARQSQSGHEVVDRSTVA